MDKYLISSANELTLLQGCNIEDILEQLDIFFEDHLVFTLGKIYSLKVLDPPILNFVNKVEDKKQWNFISSEGQTYTVFSKEAFEIMKNPILSDFLGSGILIDEKEETSEEESSEEEKKLEEEESSEEEKNLEKEKNSGKEEKSSSEESSELENILTEGWTSEENSLEGNLVGRIKLGETIIKPEGPDINFVPF